MKSCWGLLPVLLALCGCSGDSSPFGPLERKSRYISLPAIPATTQAVAASANQFSFNLFQEISRDQGATTVFISPFSASMALAMAYNGAAGKTETDMAATLGFAGLSRTEINESYKRLYDLLTGLDRRVTVKIANSVWHHNTFSVLSEFIERNQTYFNAEVRPADFRNPATVDLINDCCDRHTNARITKILDQLQANDLMALLNALYFKGTWTYEFDKSQSRDRPFTLQNGNPVNCRMMSVTGSFDYFSADDVQGVDLPYGGGLYSMTLLVPGSTQTVDELAARLTAEQWAQWKRRLQLSNGTVMMPRLKLEYEIVLDDILSRLGMAIAFNSALADFSAISKDIPLYITLVKQKTFLQVDEEGTEAAAVTAVTLGYKSTGPAKGSLLQADRPFLLMIRDHAADAILFIGKIMEPKQ